MFSLTDMCVLYIMCYIHLYSISVVKDCTWSSRHIVTTSPQAVCSWPAIEAKLRSTNVARWDFRVKYCDKLIHIDSSNWFWIVGVTFVFTVVVLWITRSWIVVLSLQTDDPQNLPYDSNTLVCNWCHWLVLFSCSFIVYRLFT